VSFNPLATNVRCTCHTMWCSKHWMSG